MKGDGFSFWKRGTRLHNKGMKQTIVEHIGRSQLIPSVIRTSGGADTMRRDMVVLLASLVVTSCRPSSGTSPAAQPTLVARESPKVSQTKISAPTAEDLARIQAQTAVAARIAKTHGGAELRGTLADLDVLQRLVDGKVLAPTQTYELQCLGIALGQVMVGNSSLRWVTVEDEYGRDPALNVPGTSALLFPLTMISKRVEEGRELPIQDLYKATVAEAERMAAAERASGKPTNES